MRQPSGLFGARAGIAGLAVVALLVSGAAGAASATSTAGAVSERAASATNASPAPAPAAVGAAPQSAQVPAPAVGTPVNEVTLISGDRVSVGVAPDGRPAIRGITPAARAGQPPVAFQTLKHGEELYVVPSDATALIADRRLDLGLFDVGYLAANGYADGRSSHLPVILRYPASTWRTTVPARADALPASARRRTLESVHAVAVDVEKERATTFWSAVVASAKQAGQGSPSTLRGGLASIWLDRKVHADLDRSVPQIGAPDAWAAGFDGTGVTVAVLDSGIDAEHPDLAGKVIEQQNFTTEADPADHLGHGTHTASTVAGTGDASEGRYRGVAPGADLLNAKVVDDDGSGNFSWVIDGMEWAVDHDARVVSMSLSGDPTDGTDPLSQAVDNLTATSGALFVIAAGNRGSAAQTIGAPGAADSALTVAAVDRSDVVASFSSRGPRAGDRGLKPDIAAPGVGIVAARANDTTQGTPVNDFYTSLSGTSMATPHVAGAAALLAQQHPDWTAPRLKHALMSTAKAGNSTAYEQGTGRVDLARAVGQGVYADGSLDFGHVAYPQADPISRTLTYTNITAKPVTLTLLPELRAYDGRPAPTGTLTLDRTTVVVPAHGSVGISARLDPRKVIGGGAYQGTVRATDANAETRLTTTIGIYNAPATATLTVSTNVPTGATQVRVGRPLVVRMDGREDLDDGPVYLPGESGTVTLAKGPYMVATSVSWKDVDGEWNHALPIAPQVDLSADTRVSFDLQKAKKLTVKAPRPTESYDAWMGYQRIDARKRWHVEGDVDAPYGAQNYWMLPTGKVTQGTFGSVSQHLRGEPLIRMTAVGQPGRLDPAYQGVDPKYPKLDGHHDLQLVAAGNGLPGDFAGVDVRGKLVLLSLDDICQDTCSADALDRVTTAANAGAAAVVGFGASGRAFLDATRQWPVYPIPTLSLPADQGRALVRTLQAAHDMVIVKTVGSAESTYVFALKFYADKVSGDPDHKVDSHDLYRIDNRIHADQPAQVTSEWAAQRAGEIVGTAHSVALASSAPRSRTEFVGPLSDTMLWQRQTIYSDGPRQEAIDLFDRPGRRTETWGSSPLVPGVSRFASDVQALGNAVPVFGVDATFCPACRTVDTFTPMFNLTDSQTNHLGDITWYLSPDLQGGDARYEQHLYRGEEEVPLEIGTFFLGCLFFCIEIPIPTYELPAGESTYRYTLSYADLYPGTLYARNVDTAWTFSSSRASGATSPEYRCWGQLLIGGDPNAPCEAEHLLYLRYGLDLDSDNTLPAGSTHAITISGYHGAQVDPEPRLTSVELLVTFDDGEHWQRVATSEVGRNTYRAVITHPPLHQTSGAVGIRAYAEDAEGNTIEQTISRAYGLDAGA
ncbi:S8 family serine peptidase [Actinopolymorpha sp. B17G11]|uniref:S8 family serine peptidase n=1 Tax=Actinopolymorpha sp. B17G11 TaxID=3160861 RepID=UPI0032E3E460